MLVLAGPLSVGVLSVTVAVPEEREEAECRVVVASLDVVVSGDDLQQVIAVAGRRPVALEEGMEDADLVAIARILARPVEE